MFKLCTTKPELVEEIKHRAIDMNHDLEVYKLTPLPHTAEIKVEVGKEEK